MSVQHFKSLLFKSALIQEEIVKENRRRWPDSMRLLKLKKMRLAIKDRMLQLIERATSQTVKKKTKGSNLHRGYKSRLQGA